MRQYADLVWSCASKAVKEQIEPNAIAQVGLRIPVHIMTPRGGEIVSHHLRTLPRTVEPDSVTPVSGEDKPILINRSGGIACIRKTEITGCVDCPTPCV